MYTLGKSHSLLYAPLNVTPSTVSNTDTLEPLKCVLIRGVSSFQGANDTFLYEVGTWSGVLIREVRCPG